MSGPTPKGPLSEWAKEVVARVPCPVEGLPAKREVMVNASGWPYLKGGFSLEMKAQSIPAAKKILSAQGIEWRKGYKRKVMAALNAPPPSVEIDEAEKEPEIEFEQPEKEKKRGLPSWLI